MLPSEHAGERASAAAAIGKVLKANNLDWHALAGLLDDTSPPSPPSPPPRNGTTWKRTDGPTTVSSILSRPAS
jgi:hypothetical protein